MKMEEAKFGQLTMIFVQVVGWKRGDVKTHSARYGFLTRSSARELVTLNGDVRVELIGGGGELRGEVHTSRLGPVLGAFRMISLTRLEDIEGTEMEDILRMMEKAKNAEERRWRIILAH